MKCTALLILSALALGSAVPIGSVYDHAHDYVKDAIYGHGFEHAYGHPFYGKHIAGVHDIDDVYRAAVHEAVGPVHDVTEGFGDDLHKKLFVKEKQWEEDKHLDEQHRLEHVHLLQEQHLLHELQHQQHMQLQEQKEALDHLHHIQEQEIHDQKEKLDHQQFVQKAQLDELHAIEDAKVAGHSVHHPAYLHGADHAYSAWHSYGHPYAAWHSYAHPYAAALHGYEHPYSAWHKSDIAYAHPGVAAWHRYVEAGHPGAFWHKSAVYGHPAYWHKTMDSARWGPYAGAAVHDVHPWGVHPWAVHHGIHNIAY
nr:unnamed protein product [Callosobruchus chinensis]